MATIQGVYVALFGRPADPAGLAYFNGITKNGADLAKIGVLSGQAEYTSRFAGQSNVQIINTIYQSLFNRDAEAAGLEFFSKALTSGTLSVNNIAIAILDGAQGTDKTVVTNKLTAADNFTKALDTATEQSAYVGNTAAEAGRNFLAPVGAATSSIPTTAATDTAVAGVVTGSTGGVSISILDANAVSPSSADVKLKTTGGDDTVTVTDLYKATSAIDTGFGSDTLVIKTIDAAVTPTAANFKNVEKVFVTATAANSVFDVTNVTGLTQVWNDTSTKTLTVNNLAAGVTVGLKGNLVEASTFALKDATSSSDSITLALDKAVVTAAKAVTLANIETVNVSVSGTSTVDSFVATSAKTIVVTGTGDFTLGGNAVTDVKNVTKIDASGLTGKFTLDLSAGATDLIAGNKVAITGTNGVDTIILENGTATLDTVIYNKADVSTFVTFETVKYFTTADDKIDLKSFALTKTAGVSTFINAIENASFGANSVAQYDAGADTFVFVDSNNDGKLNLATDFAVQLVGHAAADLTVANFVFTA